MGILHNTHEGRSGRIMTIDGKKYFVSYSGRVKNKVWKPYVYAGKADGSEFMRLPLSHEETSNLIKG